jgi:hypothetical protein
VSVEKPTVNALINTGTVIGSSYAQVARVTVSKLEITIEFAYIHPVDPTQGQSIARITMPVAAGIELGEMIVATKKLHDKRMEGQKND